MCSVNDMPQIKKCAALHISQLYRSGTCRCSKTITLTRALARQLSVAKKSQHQIASKVECDQNNQG